MPLLISGTSSRKIAIILKRKEKELFLIHALTENKPGHRVIKKSSSVNKPR
jgi:hypothetical protein